MNSVNDGNIFRFHTKPCPLPVLARSIEDGIGQHRRQMALAAENERLIEERAQNDERLRAALAETRFISRARSEFLAYTRHAEVRAQQRSIPPIVVEWLIRFGRMDRHKYGDVYFLDKQSRRQLRSYIGAIAYRRLENLFDTYIVLGDTGRVITAGRRTVRFKTA